jgi:hypothetical protein
MRLKVWIRTVALLALLVTAGTSALHSSWGRPVLMRLGGCPITSVSAAEVNELRRTGLRTLRGTGLAPARPALGFDLDRTTPDEVRAWAARARVRCEPRGHGLLALHCANVLRAALPGGRQGSGWDSLRPPQIEDLALTFDPAGHLVSVDAFTRRLRPPEAAAAFASSDARLRSLLGPATERGGDPASEALAHSPLASTTMSRFRFDDYVAILSVTRLSSGLAVRELYLSGS